MPCAGGFLLDSPHGICGAEEIIGQEYSESSFSPSNSYFTNSSFSSIART
jgi:hypothetical protein